MAKLVKSIILLGLFLGATGTLLEATGLVGKRAAEAHPIGWAYTILRFSKF